MRHGYFIAAIGITLSGCGTPTSMTTTQHALAAQARYIKCLDERARDLVWQPGKPSALAQIVLNRCKSLRDLYYPDDGSYAKLSPSEKFIRDSELELARTHVEDFIRVARGNIELGIVKKQHNDQVDRLSAKAIKLRSLERKP